MAVLLAQTLEWAVTQPQDMLNNASSKIK